MKRSEVLNVIEKALGNIEDTRNRESKNIIAENILCHLENLGFQRVEEGEDYCFTLAYEPEEGWEEWFFKKDKADSARDFQVVLRKNIYTQEIYLHRGGEIAQKFLDGKSFEELAKEYIVTRERIRQIVAKERRRYKKSLEGDDYEE